MQFTTRVELHAAAKQDYHTLHQAMEREGFSRVIQGSNGQWYELPEAEYNREANMPITDVRESAGRAASTTGRNYSVLVSEATSRAWIGLPVVAVR